MKSIQKFSLLLLLSLFAMSLTRDAASFELGDKAPLSDIEMLEVMSGKNMSLEDLNQENGLLVIFSCNTCPFVLAWEEQYPQLGKLAKENKIGMVLVNSNEAKRDDEDSMSSMKKHYEKAGYNTPYVIDKNSKLADAFGAKTTPHVYLFNKDLELIYRGSINDKYEQRDKEAKKFYLNDAIRNHIGQKSIEPADTREIGCSIKRVKV